MSRITRRTVPPAWSRRWPARSRARPGNDGRTRPTLRAVRLATWNVNSLRSRIDRVEALLERHDIDVLALQETKAREDQLPLMGLQSMGYDLAYGGHQPVERRGDPEPGRGSRTSRSASRACPAGASRWRPRAGPSARPAEACGSGRSTCPTVARSTTRTTSTSSTGWPGSARPRRRGAIRRPRWSATGTSRRRTRTSSTWRRSPRTPMSRRRSGRRSRPSSTTGTSTWCGRTHPGPEVFTYWDYYRQRFERNRGMRIDFVLGSAAFAARVTGAFIDRDERAGKGASDHAPVVVDLALTVPRLPGASGRMALDHDTRTWSHSTLACSCCGSGLDGGAGARPSRRPGPRSPPAAAHGDPVPLC